MKAVETTINIIFLLFSFSLIELTATAQGVLILNGPDGSYLPIIKSEVQVDVTNQVGTVSCSQTFYNDLGVDTVAEYAFALPEQGAALRIDYQIDGQWYEAVFSSSEQDSILPGEDSTSVTDPTATNITEFLGETPIYFEFGLVIPSGTYATFRTQYVELLDYIFNQASHVLPGDYMILGQSSVDTFYYSASIQSQRDMLAIELNSQSGQLIQGNLINPNSGTIAYSSIDFETETNITLQYEMVNANFGMMDFSTLLPDSAHKCDTLGNGFVGLILEPEGVQTEVVDKDFILIIDVSGSMTGNKISDAKQAAHYVLDNLNPNDRFNIVAFSSSSFAFSTNLQSSSPINVSNGHAFVDGLSATGTTNISSSFDLSIPMFSSSLAQNAKVVVFLTDGQANGGISNTTDLVAHVNGLVQGVGLSYDFSLFCFGVDGANQQLLNQLANQNNGASFFINSATLSSVMTDFYNTIQNPVILGTQIHFDPPIVTEVYPIQLPNLYLGQQLVVFGRYDSVATTQVTISGYNYGSAVSYSYSLNLADTVQEEYGFLPKMWAKKYIDYQVTQYYSQSNLNSSEADSIRQLVITSSLCNGVLSPFTSFQQDPNGGGGSVGLEEEDVQTNGPLRAFPNPFSDHIVIDLEMFEGKDVQLEIYDVLGNLVYRVNSFGADRLTWKGDNMHGKAMSAGVYFVRLIVAGDVYSTRIEKL
jgi:Ca-activated chloride channel family protein